MKIIELEKQPDGTYSENLKPSKNRRQAIVRHERRIPKRERNDPIETLFNAAVYQLEREARKLIRNLFK